MRILNYKVIDNQLYLKVIHKDKCGDAYSLDGETLSAKGDTIPYCFYCIFNHFPDTSNTNFYCNLGSKCDIRHYGYYIDMNNGI